MLVLVCSWMTYQPAISLPAVSKMAKQIVQHILLYLFHYGIDNLSYMDDVL